MKIPPAFRQRFTFLAAGFAAGVLALAAWIAVQNHHSTVSPGAIPAQRASASADRSALIDAIQAIPDVAAPASDPAVIRVAARFRCACPDECGQPVAQCLCPTATAERAFLYEQLQKGRGEAEAEQALNKKYGGLEL